MASILPQGKTQFFNALGVPLAGGSVYTYVPGTTTPATTWQNQAQTIANSNPITLDSSGSCLLWGSGAYRLQIFDDIGVLESDTVSYSPVIPNADGTITATPATNANELITLGQAQADFAAINGSASEAFNVAAGAGTEAVNATQLQNGTFTPSFASATVANVATSGGTRVPNAASFSAGGSNNSSGSSQNIETYISFTAPCNCTILVNANGGTGSGSVNGAGFNVSGARVAYSEANWASGSQLSAGTLVATATAGSAVAIGWYTTCVSVSQITIGQTFLLVPTP